MGNETYKMARPDPYIPLLVAAPDGGEILRITADRRLEFAPGATPEDAAAAISRAFEGIWPMSPHAESIARVCHEANRALCQAFGDDSQPAWEDAPDWQRDSAIKGVAAIRAGLVTRPQDSHESWMAEKVAAGWTYGRKKDPEAKTHPCMVPFEDLPPSQQMKDYVFLAIAKALLGHRPAMVTNDTPRTEDSMAEIDQNEIQTRFTYHPPRDEMVGKFGKIRAEAKQLAESINFLCPDSREKSLAITKIEEAVMWANAAIARREP